MIKTEAQKRWPDFITPVARVILPLFFVLVFGIVQMIRFGFDGSDYALLFLGSILSLIATCAYPATGYFYGATGKKSYFAMSLVFFESVIPLIFGAYLIFLRGFWSLMELRNGFEILIIIKSIAFIALGYIFISNFSKMTDLYRSYIDMAKKNDWINSNGK